MAGHERLSSPPCCVSGRFDHPDEWFTTKHLWQHRDELGSPFNDHWGISAAEETLVDDGAHQDVLLAPSRHTRRVFKTHLHVDLVTFEIVHYHIKAEHLRRG